MHLISITLVFLKVLGCFSVRKESLSGTWSLIEPNGEFGKLSGTVPGGIFTDLIQNRIIEDPIFKDNDQKTKWVGRTNWTYFSNFTVDAEFLANSNINLVFDGLDTISTIFLNGKQIGISENMFVRYIFDIKEDILSGNNSLEVRFQSPVKAAEQTALKQKESYSVPPECPPSDYRGECHINELRKMQASFAWDWGPALASVGIWKEVYLEAFNTNAIRYVVVTMEEDELDSIWNVSVVSYLSGNSMKRATGRLIYHLNTDYETQLTIVKEVKESTNDLDEVEISQNIEVSQGSVRRWWPNGYGEQCLYNLTVTFISGDEQDSYTQIIGFRTVELVQKEVEVAKGKAGNTFYFKINGLPIFAKGSNAIPLNILPEKGQDKQAIDRLMKNAKDCHMNMLRVWGGGVYESDYYYQKADELGIMIWQDFMFACALYPSRSDFLSNVVKEVRHQVRRIGSHPSIVTWAGNNENEAALTGNWYGSNGRQVYNDDYIKLYFKTIKPEFEKLLRNGIFIGSSPSNGVKTEEDGGISKNPYDQHYGDDHTYIYQLDGFNPNIYPTPRFSSEYGLQSLPALSTLSKATNNTSDLVIDSDFMKNRQHHPLGDFEFGILIFYQLDLPDKSSPNYTDVFIFYTQIIQAVSIKTETEHYRKYRSFLTEDGKGLTMGALYWQLNDVWIAPTWSGIDATGQWKMLQYFIKNAFSPIVVIGHMKPDSRLEVTVVSDQTTSIEEASLSIAVYNWTSFTPMNVTTMNITIDRGSSKNILTIPTDTYLEQIGCGSLRTARRNCFFHLTLSKSETSIAPENFVIPTALKKLNLQMPNIQIISVDFSNKDNKREFRIVLKSSEIALFVWINCRGVAGRFSENGFHQINESKIIYFHSEQDTSVENVKKNLGLSNLLSVNSF